VQASSSSAGGNLTATNATASDNGIITVDLEAEVTTPEASSGSEPVAAQDSADSNQDGEDVDSPVKPIAGGGQLIKGSPSGKAPDTDTQQCQIGLRTPNKRLGKPLSQIVWNATIADTTMVRDSSTVKIMQKSLQLQTPRQSKESSLRDK
jgi:hypothetical protein